MTIYQKLCLIRDEHFHELRNEKEKQFIEDMYDGVNGVSSAITDDEMDEYLSPRQVEWINDIWNCVGNGEEPERSPVDVHNYKLR